MSKKRWFKLEVGLDTRWFWFHVSTPDFTTTNPDLYPSWRPKWLFADNKWVCESRYMFMFSWILFGFGLSWGEPLPRPNPPRPPERPAHGYDLSDDIYSCDLED